MADQLSSDNKTALIEEIIHIVPPTRGLVEQARVNLAALSDKELLALCAKAREAAELCLRLHVPESEAAGKAAYACAAARMRTARLKYALATGRKTL